MKHHGKTSEEKYYIKGWVSSLDATNADGIDSYGNATFFMAARNDGTADKYSFEAYQVYGKDGKTLASTMQVQVGDFVVIYGQIMKYGTQPETPGKGAAYIYSSTNEYFDPKEDLSSRRQRISCVKGERYRFILYRMRSRPFRPG